MTYSETRAHLQSFETKMEFIRPELTDITVVLNLEIKKKIEKFLNLIAVKGLTNGGKY